MPVKSKLPRIFNDLFVWLGNNLPEGAAKLFRQNGFFDLVFNTYASAYIAFLLVFLTWVLLYKTPLGLNIRSVGENPVVVESVGISVKRLRYMACVAGGMLVGLGGAVLSTGILSQFTENMTDGRGFIALAAVTFGKYTPFGTLGGVIVFGIGETLSYRLQAGGGAFPYEFALMLPYVLTVLALCVFSRNAKDPAALGVPYYKSH